jgi:LPXTG-motif cell wall-anchored protein
MNSLQLTRKPVYRLLAAGIVCIAFAVAMMAQDTTKTTVKEEAASHKVQVERGEVVYVSGNDLVVRMENGEVRHFTVPDTARVTVDGRQLSVHELKPGMKLERTITTTSTPKLVTTVRTIQGKVFHVSAPSSVILTLPDGTNKKYKVPKDQKFMIDGQAKTVFELRKGMNVAATVLTQVPENVVAEQRKVTGSAPPPPDIPKMEGALLIEDIPAPRQIAAAPAPEPQAPAAEPAPKKLPKTGSMVPLVGLLGLLSLGLSFGVRMLRRS